MFTQEYLTKWERIYLVYTGCFIVFCALIILIITIRLKYSKHFVNPNAHWVDQWGLLIVSVLMLMYAPVIYETSKRIIILVYSVIHLLVYGKGIDPNQDPFDPVLVLEEIKKQREQRDPMDKLRQEDQEKKMRRLVDDVVQEVQSLQQQEVLQEQMNQAIQLLLEPIFENKISDDLYHSGQSNLVPGL